MHLVPEARRDRRMIDSDRVCKAIDALGDPSDVAAWAGRFGLLGDRSRLALLLAISEAGPISVTDLGVVADMNDTTVSQALRLLRASGTVTAQRDGRVMRYALADNHIAELLKHVTAPHVRRHRHAT
jgi:ArsR family transcriptional regulator, lead/cadmium/zinc/bismuth-responsive transcriptional repressor